MSFDLARTPTLEAVATADEQALAHHLQKRVDEAVAAAAARQDVIKARAAHRKGEDRLARLRQAERALTAYTKDLRERAAATEQAAMEAIIESASAEKSIDFKRLDALAGLEHQNRIAGRAIEHMVETMIPAAHLQSLRAESHSLMTEARAIEQIAQERAEKVLGALRDAVNEEMVLPVDLSKGVSGALVAHAAGLKRCAVQISESADEAERALKSGGRDGDEQLQEPGARPR